MSDRLREHHVAPDTKPFDVRWKLTYIKYGTNPDLKQKYLSELYTGGNK